MLAIVIDSTGMPDDADTVASAHVSEPSALYCTSKPVAFLVLLLPTVKSTDVPSCPRCPETYSGAAGAVYIVPLVPYDE